MNLKDENCLIAYFSRKGDNYVSGRIVNLQIGNTEVVAKMICGMTAGNLFSIDTVTQYPVDYAETTKVAQKEKGENARPEITSHLENMNFYSLVFLGYPNWWGTMPMPVFSFLESYDFSGKTIIPFCTHEGSGLGRSEKDIASLCPKTTILNGLAIHGSSVKNAKQDIEKWLSKIR